MNIVGKEIDRIAVVGTGLIGLGWSIVFARSGIETRACDPDQAQLDLLNSRLFGSLATMRKAGWIADPEIEATVARIHMSTDIAVALDGVGYVQECVPERLELKQEVFTELDQRLPAEVVIGSSTSAIPMSHIAQNTQHPERCVVVHPTNPPHVAPLVEIVPGELTTPETVEFARRLMEAVGQCPIICRKEIPGFVLNRLQFALEREAFYLAREGVASVADIDRVVSEGLGLRWALLGPFLVEETNGADVRDDLTRFSLAIDGLMAQVCKPFDKLTSDDVDRVEAGVHELMGDLSHDDLLAYRDELVLTLRRLKAAWKPV
ncbi:MAG TPA: 3-hydroxyacyl-CoA dehydrogenase NAD-binding domain-containing protein [Chloroflexota bacterium]|jgi:3-hydroxyacyl-CoA dehydrogenase|nr:3-hydroxyacyl-CoA dehydrogenase NAD-binding domain-containing protein [Chloroflexota bacterium]